LGPAALDVLRRAIGDRKEGYVFINPQTGTRYTSIHKKFDQVVRELGLTAADGTKLRFHDLRHVFATWLHREGVSLDSLRFLLGHLDRTTTDRYTTVDRVALGDVLSLLPRLGRESKKKASILPKPRLHRKAAGTNGHT
jgi:site-specific recombinase XerD